jgi:nitrite reductase/ring-hydroxylating ferredoxin subunit
MKRRSFLQVAVGILALLPSTAIAASKTPTPKPKPKKTVKTPTPSSMPKLGTTPSPASLETPVIKDGAIIKLDSLVAPISLYATVSKSGRDYPVLVAKPTDRTIKVFTARCPHQGNILNLAEKGEFSCDLHGARFDESTGKVIDGPTINNLDSYEVVERNGALYIKF